MFHYYPSSPLPYCSGKNAITYLTFFVWQLPLQLWWPSMPSKWQVPLRHPQQWLGFLPVGPIRMELYTETLSRKQFYYVGCHFQKLFQSFTDYTSVAGARLIAAQRKITVLLCCMSPSSTVFSNFWLISKHAHIIISKRIQNISWKLICKFYLLLKYACLETVHISSSKSVNLSVTWEISFERKEEERHSKKPLLLKVPNSNLIQDF